MLSLVAAFALARQEVQEISINDLKSPVGGAPRTEIRFTPEDRLKTPKLSPKKFGGQPFEFDFATLGYALLRDPKDGQVKGFPRFFVYEQERKEKNDVAFAVTEELLRLWEHLLYDLRLDHGALHGGLQDVDVYLCWGGQPGGEQLWDTDTSFKSLGGENDQRVNTIYIYDLPSFTDPVEMCREVAHEYGHATLPPIGGYKSPEYWANGYFGEKLYLTYLRNEILAGKLAPQDAMGAMGPELDKWVRKNVDPLVVEAAAGPPDPALMADTGQAGMDAFMGLMLYCSELFPKPAYAYFLSLLFPHDKTIPTVDPKEIPPLIPIVIDRYPEVPLTVPEGLAGKPFWIPVSGAKVVGAEVLNTKDGWAEIKPTGGPLKLVNPAR